MNRFLYNYLCCPACKKHLITKKDGLACRACKVTYEVRKGIPILVHLQSLPPHLRSQIAYFEKEDEKRIRWVLEPWQKRYVDNFLAYGKLRQQGIIVDNATGSGYMTVELAKRGFRIIATDVTFLELVKLKAMLSDQRLENQVLLVCCDSQWLPVRSNIADGLVANAILEHLPGETQAVKEIQRVIKKGAAIMVAMPIAYYLLLPILWLPNWIHDRKIGHLRRYTRKRIRAIFRNCFEIQTYYTGHIVKVLCLLFYLVTKNTWWMYIGEKVDKIFQKIPYGANNIVSVLKKI